MRFADGRGYQTLRWVPNVMLRADDISTIGQDAYTNLAATLSAVVGGIRGEDHDVILTGMSLTHTTNLTAELSPGIAVSYSGRYMTEGAWGFVASPGDVFAVAVGETQNVGFVPGGAASRIDTVEIRPVLIDFKSRFRDFKDPVTGLLSTAPHDTKREYGYEFVVHEGTEGAGVAPDVTPGWVKIAEVVVAASATSLSQDNFYNADRSHLWTTDTRATVWTLVDNDADWTDVTSLDNGWGGLVRYIKRFGMVTVTMLANGSSKTSDVMMTLPPGYRPSQDVWASANDGTSSRRISITSSGLVANDGTGLNIAGMAQFPVIT